MKHKRLIISKKYHALTSISEAKEHSLDGGFLCEEKQAIRTSNDISEAHEAFYKAIPKRYKWSAMSILLEICPRGNNKMVITVFPCSW